MKILITGGAGFIGSHLVKRLFEEKHEVVVLDNLLNGNKIDPEILRKIEMIEGDIRDKDLVFDSVKGCQIVFHFAAVLGVDVVADQPVETMDVEVIGTRNVIEAVNHHKTNQLFYASTSGIYSHSAIVKTALSEDVLVDPRTSYAMAKRYNEIYLASHHQEHDTDIIALRFFNVYGENQDSRMVIPRFFEQALQNDHLTVYGNGLQTRDFTYIDDVIESCMRLIGHKGFEIVNIANEKEWTVADLAELILSITDSDAKIKFIEAPKKRYDYEVERRIGSSTKLEQMIQFKPSTTLGDGLRKIYNTKYSKNGERQGTV